MTDKLNISLEPHLRDALATILRFLPEEIAQQMSLYLSPEKNTTEVVPVIPYQLVFKVSRWCQTAAGKTALQASSPPLDPQSYTMVSLLAGTRTSPEKHFAPYVAKDPEEDQRLQTKDKKAIATLVNAVLSILGTGVATFWASERTGMQLEWRTLTAMGAALVVALAEIILYIIWNSRQVKQSRKPARGYVAVDRKDSAEGNSDPDVTPQASSTAVEDTNLRHRTITSANLPFLDVS